MRRSPLLHPLAVLRTMIGLTQKEMGVLAGRAARTIQAVELKKLPLSQDLAILIAEATGVDVGWLLEGNCDAPPRKGLMAQRIGSGRGIYRREDFEFHRAFMEAPVAPKEEMEAAIKGAAEGQKKGEKLVTLSLPVAKAAMLMHKKRVQKLEDQKLVASLERLLEKTAVTPRGDVVRWRTRRLLAELQLNSS